MEKTFSREERAEQLKEEALKMKSFFDSFEADFKDETKMFFFLLSMNWLNQWKRFIDYEHTSIGMEPISPNFAEDEPKKMNSDLISDELLIKCNDINHYCNILLKPNLTCDVDYILLT